MTAHLPSNFSISSMAPAPSSPSAGWAMKLQPAITERTARTINGKVIVAGPSWACPAAPLRAGRRETDRADHVSELRERRVSEDALDVILLRGHERGHHGGEDADPGDDALRGRGKLDEEGHARQHVNAGSDHRRRVDQRGNR